MNRREAIAALTALPGVARIAKVEPEPADVIVVECDGNLTEAVAQKIKENINSVWPGHRVLILADGIRIKLAG